MARYCTICSQGWCAEPKHALPTAWQISKCQDHCHCSMDNASRKTRNHVPTTLTRNWKDPNVLQINTCGETLIYTSSYGPNCQIIHEHGWTSQQRRGILTTPAVWITSTTVYRCLSIWHLDGYSLACNMWQCAGAFTRQLLTQLTAIQVLLLATAKMNIRKVPGGRGAGYPRSPLGTPRKLIFPECVARVPVSLWGSGGWGCVRSTLPNRPQPFATVATVRNRPRKPLMAVPSSAKGVIFGGVKRHVASSFRVAGVALRDIQTCFVTRRKSF